MALLCVDSHDLFNIVNTVMVAVFPYSVLRDQIFTHPTMSESFNDLFSLIKKNINNIAKIFRAIICLSDHNNTNGQK
ncbi:hypothetical protein AF376_23235, partial [Salmonella enterica subsp. enterica serovar Typhimurium]